VSRRDATASGRMIFVISLVPIIKDKCGVDIIIILPIEKKEVQ
jgi:hypothetical protein